MLCGLKAILNEVSMSRHFENHRYARRLHERRLTLLSLHDRVAPGCLAGPRDPKLRRTLLRVEVHVNQPEAVAEAGPPLEVVHQAPLEVTLDRNAVGGRPLELRHVSAQEHDRSVSWTVPSSSNTSLVAQPFSVMKISCAPQCLTGKALLDLVAGFTAPKSEIGHTFGRMTMRRKARTLHL